tara:strand:- start:38 stop:601 length:564 start_codon:yes stop_codon:yes gene_type:complete
MQQVNQKSEEQSSKGKEYLKWVIFAIPCSIFLWEGLKGLAFASSYIKTPLSVIISALLILCISFSIRTNRKIAKEYKENKKSAELGDADAQFFLGDFYYFGGIWRVGWKVDFKEAFKWYHKAADQSHGSARTRIGAMYQYGQGVDQDFKKAIKWFRLAADQGNKDAKENLQSLLKEHPELREDYSSP